MSEHKQKSLKDGLSEVYEELSHVDSCKIAEDMTGKGLGDKQTGALALSIHMKALEEKKRVLTVLDDTMFGDNIKRYLRIVGDEGFEKAYELPFVDRDGRIETFYVFWHPTDGVLLVFDTFHDGVNGGHFYYNWYPNKLPKDFDYWNCISSGHWQNPHGIDHDDWGVWVGSHDCREGLRHNLVRLRSNGKFVVPWDEQPYLHLTHHGDKIDNKDYEKLKESFDEPTAKRIAALPEHVRKCVAGK